MDNKQKKILQAVIFEYIETSRPVSSKQLVSKCGYSASSIRNRMTKLSKIGYLESIHTSSGKIPTDKGWRYLISELLEIQREILDGKKDLKKNYKEQVEKENSALVELSKTFFYILENSEYNLSPNLKKTFFREIILKMVDRKTVFGVIFSSAGVVKSFTVKAEKPVKQEFLDGVGILLNEILCGVTLSEIKNNFEEKTKLFESEYQRKIDFIRSYFINKDESDRSQTASKSKEAIKENIYAFSTIWKKVSERNPAGGTENERENK
ncbi:MAG: hypothetical protein CVU80_01790 [Elusimicrobia bacterium HGW-Elusimicrobia-4]|nr:MAG: hypothetical protein CVU80_01790 [Elusimicrobia bacterium HGW-Elusimicrobia-4]